MNTPSPTTELEAKIIAQARHNFYHRMEELTRPIYNMMQTGEARQLLVDLTKDLYKAEADSIGYTAITAFLAKVEKLSEQVAEISQVTEHLADRLNQ